MNLLDELETELPFELTPCGSNQAKANIITKKTNKSSNIYPVLIVDNLSKFFGKIDKNNSKKPPKISRDEEILLTLIARIIVEIFIKEEL